MAKLQCKYCGSFIEDTLEYCDYCGALNENHQRIAKDTPKTIEELKEWYIRRKLPPENVTRFFIGKNIREPKACGIYRDGKNVILYKNKSDGQRAIRYKGTDEAYAVNELYLKLKEEILRQKNNNYNRKKNNTVNTYSNRNYKKKNNSLFSIFAIGSIIFTSLMFLMAFGLFFLSVFTPIINEGYFLDDNRNLYYREEVKVENNCTWWSFDKEDNEWEFYDTLNKKKYPESVDKDDFHKYVSEISEILNIDEEIIDIYNSKTFIDAGNHKTPRTSYYEYNENIYYYLDDVHSQYGTDNSGWYIYKNDDWEYYCSKDDKEKLGEDLWYYDKNYTTTQSSLIYDWDGDLSESWNTDTFKTFETTDWYKSYESNEQEYQKELERKEQERQDRYDDDDDYDWNNDYDWDSDDYDWDSDW